MDGPIPHLFSKIENVWWVHPTKLDMRKFTLSIEELPLLCAMLEMSSRNWLVTGLPSNLVPNHFKVLNSKIFCHKSRN